MKLQLLLATFLIFLGGCAVIPGRAALDGSWPVTGASIDAAIRDEVSDLYARYSLYADAPAGEAYAALFSEQGEIVMGPLRITGRDALARRIGDKSRQTIHLQGAPVLVQLGPDRIIARTPVILGTRALAKDPVDGNSGLPTLQFSFYDDELIRTARGWKFERRTARTSPTPTAEFLRGYLPSDER
jgi:hypothetical protein